MVRLGKVQQSRRCSAAHHITRRSLSNSSHPARRSLGLRRHLPGAAVDNDGRDETKTIRVRVHWLVVGGGFCAVAGCSACGVAAGLRGTGERGAEGTSYGVVAFRQA